MEEVSICVVLLLALTSFRASLLHTLLGSGDGPLCALGGTAFFLGRTSTLEEEVKEEENEEEDQLLPCSADAELLLPLDES